MKRVRTVAVILALAALTARAEQTKFDAPRANGYRVDACRSWGQGCGKEAADAFCRLNKFESASAFEIDPRIGAKIPTMTIEDRKICNQPQCDGFKSITCTRSDAATGKQSQPPGTVRVPPGLLDAFKKGGGVTPPPTTPPPPTTTPPPTTPSPTTPSPTPPTRVPEPRLPRNPALAARLDPAEFVVITPKRPTATLGRFGASAPSGTLEEQRTVALNTNADLVQTGAADVDGDGLSELLLLETPNPVKPEKSTLRFLKLSPDLTFAPILETITLLGKGLPMLASGRFVAGDRSEQALVYAPGEAAAIVRWTRTPSAAGPADYVVVEGWQPKGALIVLDATGDGQDDLLDYTEAGSLDLVTLGPLQSNAWGRLAMATARPLLTLGPKRQFAVGDFTGDGRTDLLIHDGMASSASIVQFDNAGGVRSQVTAATDWPSTYTWTRGYDYDGDGRDDLVISDQTGLMAVVRFTGDGSLRDKTVITQATSTENLRFPGYFMANGRASHLSHMRKTNKLFHIWFEVVGGTVAVRPALNEPRVPLLENIPEGALVVVGNFRRDR